MPTNPTGNKARVTGHHRKAAQSVLADEMHAQYPCAPSDLCSRFARQYESEVFNTTKDKRTYMKEILDVQRRVPVETQEGTEIYFQKCERAQQDGSEMPSHPYTGFVGFQMCCEGHEPGIFPPADIDSDSDTSEVLFTPLTVVRQEQAVPQVRVIPHSRSRGASVESTPTLGSRPNRCGEKGMEISLAPPSQSRSSRSQLSSGKGGSHPIVRSGTYEREFVNEDDMRLTFRQSRPAPIEYPTHAPGTSVIQKSTQEIPVAGRILKHKKKRLVHKRPVSSSSGIPPGSRNEGTKIRDMLSSFLDTTPASSVQYSDEQFYSQEAHSVTQNSAMKGGATPIQNPPIESQSEEQKPVLRRLFKEVHPNPPIVLGNTVPPLPCFANEVDDYENYSEVVEEPRTLAQTSSPPCPPNNDPDQYLSHEQIPVCDTIQDVLYTYDLPSNPPPAQGNEHIIGMPPALELEFDQESINLHQNSLLPLQEQFEGYPVTQESQLEVGLQNEPVTEAPEYRQNIAGPNFFSQEPHLIQNELVENEAVNEAQQAEGGVDLLGLFYPDTSPVQDEAPLLTDDWLQGGESEFPQILPEDPYWEWSPSQHYYKNTRTSFAPSDVQGSFGSLVDTVTRDTFRYEFGSSPPGTARTDKDAENENIEVDSIPLPSTNLDIGTTQLKSPIIEATNIPVGLPSVNGVSQVVPEEGINKCLDLMFGKMQGEEHHSSGTDSSLLLSDF